MHADIDVVEELLHGSSIYQIPHFQRSYSWTRKHWHRLWSDVLAVAGDPSGRRHFLGPLVCRSLPRGPGDSIGRFEVIDGQQRLTTISVMLGAMRDLAQNEGRQDLAGRINEDYLIHHRRGGSERYKLVPRLSDRKVWNALVEGRDAPTGDMSDRSMIDEAWSWFAGRAASLRFLEEGDLADPADPDFLSVLEAVVQRLAFVSITIDDDNPYRVFESLNTTGLALTEFDLVRNHLFMRVPIDDQERFESDAWSKFERVWNDAADAGSSAEKAATRFIHHFLMRIHGAFKRGDIFMQFRRWADDRMEGQGEDSYDIVRTLSRFAVYADRFQQAERIRSSRSKGEGGADWPNDDIDQALLRIAYCDSGTATPLLLELFDRAERGEMGADELAMCLQDMVSLFVRRAVARDTNKHYNKRFAEIARRLEAPIREHLWREYHLIGWPGDEACLSAIERHPIYSSDSGKARLILEEIERSEGSKEPVQLARLQVEHVLPQTLSGDGETDWKSALGDEWELRHAEVVDTIGNLTLTGWNVELSNHTFSRKRDAYSRSPLSLNRELAACDAWTAESIEQRSRELMRRFLERFPRHGTPVVVRKGRRRRSERGDRNRRFWRAFAERVLDRTGEPLQAVIGSKPNLTWQTKFASVSLLPWIDLHRRSYGNWIQFKSAAGAEIFEKVRPHLSELRKAIGIEFELGFTEGGRPRLELAPQFVSDSASEDSQMAEAAADHFLSVAESLEGVLAGLGLRERARIRSHESLRYRWNRSLLDVAKGHSELHAKSSCGYGQGVYAPAGFPGGYYKYVSTKKRCRYQLTIEKRDSDPAVHLRRFDVLWRHRDGIESTTGKLEWSRDKNATNASVYGTLPGGNAAPEEEWLEIQTRLVEAMGRLYEAVSPIIESEEFRGV
jgi:hypothetical protein